MRRYFILFLAVCCLTACSSDNSDKSGAASAPDRFDVANATYIGVYNEPVTLSNGRWQGKPFDEQGAARPTVELAGGFLKTGDLTGDGIPEALVMLVERSGGSGTFQYIAVMGRDGEKVVNLGTASIGDRVQIVSVRIENGSVLTDVVQAGPADAMCCPTQLAHRVWRLDSGALREVSTNVTGKLSIAVLDSTEWVLDRFTWNESAPEEPEITLVFEEGRVAGKGGCNRYFGDVKESSPGEIAIGQIGATRMACPEEVMVVEQRYHEALGDVTSYTFIAEQLVLWYMVDGAYRTMVFHRR